MLPGIEMMTCPNLSAPAEVMQHIVEVESGRNPFAIGVVGGRLERQPQNLEEAVATARMLESQGYNFSLGLAQVNKANLVKYGLDSYEKAFQSCANLTAGSQILAQCFNESHGDWGKAFSCYYSGNFTTGYQDGYVQKVFDAINRAADNNVAGGPIPLIADAAPSRRASVGPVAIVGNESAQRIAMRRVIDSVASASLVPAMAGQLNNMQAPLPAQAPGAPTDITNGAPMAVPSAPTAATAAQASVPATISATAEASVPAAAGTSTNDVFVPVVHGPNDPPGMQTPGATAQQTAMAPVATGVDQADLRQPEHDTAFVF